MKNFLIFLIFLSFLVGVASTQTTLSGSVTISGSNAKIGCVGFVPWFCSPTNSAVDQTSAPAGLIGITGAGSSVADPATANLIVRCTDIMSGTGFRGYRTKSDSNDNVFNVGDTILAALQTGTGAGILLSWNGTACTPRGKVSALFNAENVSPSHVDANKFFGSLIGSLIQTGELNPASATWTGSTSANNDVSAAFTINTLQDVSASNCLSGNFLKLSTVADLYQIDSADRFLSATVHLIQDEGYQLLLLDTTIPGCHWIDTRQMTEGGSWGHAGAINFGTSVQLPAPAAPTVVAANTGGGTLINGHQYAVTVTETKNDVGHSPTSAATLVTVNSPNNSLSVTSPTSTPSNTATVPTGYRMQACDNTAVPGCTPVDQINGTNASGALARAVINSVVCTSNCVGSSNFTLWAYGINAGGQSPLSAPATINSVGTTAVLTVTLAQDANAATYSIALNNTFVLVVRNQAGTCAAGACTFTVHTAESNCGCFVRENETVPIGTTAVILSLDPDNNPGPTDNTSGFKYHNARSDISGTWIRAEPSAIHNNASYPGELRSFFDVRNGQVVYLTGVLGTESVALNIAGSGHNPTVDTGHQAMGNGQVFSFLGGGGGNFGVITLNDLEANVFATTLGPPGGASDAHFSSQILSASSTGPVYYGSDGNSYVSHAVPNTYLTLYLAGFAQDGSQRVWKLCQDWQSGFGGFENQVSGNISSSHKTLVFSSDMGIGVGVTSGQLGSSANGGATCTDNVDCRTDLFICLPR